MTNKQFEAKLDAFCRRVHRAIQYARTRMTDEQVEKADREAAAILDRASADFRKPRRKKKA